MIELKLMDWLWALLLMWVASVERRMWLKTNRNEIELRQQVNDVVQRELKEDLKRLEDKLDKIYDLFVPPPKK